MRRGRAIHPGPFFMPTRTLREARGGSAPGSHVAAQRIAPVVESLALAAPGIAPVSALHGPTTEEVHGTKDRRRFPSGSPALLRQVRARLHRSPRIPRRRGQVRGRRRHRDDAARSADPAVRARAEGRQGRQEDQRELRRVRVAAKARARCAAIWCSPRTRPASSPASSSCTRIAGSIRTSRTSRAVSRSTISSRSRPTGSFRWAAIPATRTRRASSSPSSIRRKPARISSLPRTS